MNVPEAKGVVELEVETVSFLVAVDEIELVVVTLSERVMNVLKAKLDKPDQNDVLVVLVTERLEAREAARMDLKPAAAEEVLESVMMLLQYHLERFGGPEI